MKEVILFLHESFFEELAEKSNFGEEGNEYSASVHLTKRIIWENSSTGAGETKYGYATDQIIDSVEEEEYSKKLSGEVASREGTELGIVNVSQGNTKLENLIDAARKFYTFNEEAEEVIIVTSHEQEEDIRDKAGSDCEIMIKNPEAALDYADKSDSPINR